MAMGIGRGECCTQQILITTVKGWLLPSAWNRLAMTCGTTAVKLPYITHEGQQRPGIGNGKPSGRTYLTMADLDGDAWEQAKARPMPECEISGVVEWVPFYGATGIEILLACKFCHTPLDEQPEAGEAPLWWDSCCPEFDLTIKNGKLTDLLFELHGEHA